MVAQQLASSLDTKIKKEGSADRESAKDGEKDLDNLLISQLRVS